MTRRDFILIARVLRDSGAGKATREAFADELAHTNPKFDRSRFLRESEPQATLAGYGTPNWSTADPVRRALLGFTALVSYLQRTTSPEEWATHGDWNRVQAEGLRALNDAGNPREGAQAA